MKNIDINEIHEETELNAETLEAVKGGPAFLKFEVVDGEVMSRPTESFSLNFEEIKL